MKKHKLIFGFTGSGKTTYLKQIEVLKEYDEYIDLDEFILICHPAFNSIGELICKNGFAFFRNLEIIYLKKLINSKKSYCISLGGGTITEDFLVHFNHLEFDIKFLDVDFETCWQRIENDESRPIVKKGRQYCQEIYNQRKLLFFKFLGRTL
ncbi:MAG: hypothetical protein N4A33_05280 [Bacteriovoracaceae bacterium]|nr:hypothetical protein [Bacteriovoracaceae bacterium]